jgi:hypothetical protein
MSYNIIILIIGWLVALAIFLGFILLLRYIQYREHMALLTHGLNPNDLQRQRRNRGILRAGLITMMVGLSFTIGLYPIGFLISHSLTATPFHLGPWLLPGLIPFGVGIALIISYYLEQSSPISTEDHNHKDKGNTTQDHQDDHKVISPQNHIHNGHRKDPFV